MASGVLLRHHRNLKLSEPFCRGGNKRHAATEADHEVHRLGRASLGWNNEVPLVLSVGVINHDDHSTGLEFFKRLGNRCDERSHTALFYEQRRLVSSGYHRQQAPAPAWGAWISLPPLESTGISTTQRRP